MMWPGRRCRRRAEARVLDRRGADDHVGDAGVEGALDGVEVTDAAAQLDGDLVADLGQDRLDGGLVLRLAGEGAIEVDQMQSAPCSIQWRAVARDLRRTRWQRPFRLV